MNKTSTYFINSFFFYLLFSCASIYGQTKNISTIKNSAFPESWDNNRDLRGRNGKVLAWTHIKSGSRTEAKSCITLVVGHDSTGNLEYFLSEMYTNERPFNKWNHAWVHYLPNNSDSISGLRIGFFDTHIERFKNKPTEKELYDLLSKWKFYLMYKESKTVEAGIDETLWLETFGFLVDKAKFIKTK